MMNGPVDSAADLQIKVKRLEKEIARMQTKFYIDLSEIQELIQDKIIELELSAKEKVM
jgi:hypothetical protein